VREITPTSILVEIGAIGACSSCEVKGSCVVGGEEYKIIEVEKRGFVQFEIGERVSVKMRDTLGYKALWIAYLIPLLLLILSISILYKIGAQELYIALITIGVLSLYFFGLTIFRNNFKREFAFEIEKLDN